MIAVADAIPYPSLALAPAHASLSSKIAGTYAADEIGRAVWLNTLGVLLGDLGRREEALTAIDEAVTAYRALAEARPDAFLPDLAMSLNNQSERLSDLGRREGALGAIDEAVTIRRALAAGPPRRLPPRPRHVAEQPVGPAGGPGAAGGGAGRDRGGRHHLPAAGRRPAPTPSSPTSPRR